MTSLGITSLSVVVRLRTASSVGSRVIELYITEVILSPATPAEIKVTLVPIVRSLRRISQEERILHCLKFPLAIYGEIFGIYLVCLPLNKLEIIHVKNWFEFNHVQIQYYNKFVSFMEIK